PAQALRGHPRRGGQRGRAQRGDREDAGQRAPPVHARHRQGARTAGEGEAEDLPDPTRARARGQAGRRPDRGVLLLLTSPGDPAPAGTAADTQAGSPASPPDGSSRLTVLAGPTAVGKGTLTAWMREHHPEIWIS